MIILIYTFLCFIIATITTTSTAFIVKEQRQVHSTYNNFDPCTYCGCRSTDGTSIRWKHSYRTTTTIISSLTMIQLRMNNNKNNNDDETTITPKSETLQSFSSDTNVSNNDNIDTRTTTTTTTFNILQSSSQEKEETDLSIVPIPMFTGILILFGSLYITFYGFYVGLYGYPSENDTSSIGSVLPRIF